MNVVTPQMQELARQIVVGEIATRGTEGSPEVNALRICEKLRPRLSTLMGRAGFSGLLARALSLSVPHAPCLRNLSARPDGTLAGVDEVEAAGKRKEIADGSSILLAQLLGLLEIFIGETLTLQVVQDAWPKPPLDKSGFKPDSSDDVPK